MQWPLVCVSPILKIEHLITLEATSVALSIPFSFLFEELTTKLFSVYHFLCFIVLPLVFVILRTDFSVLFLFFWHWVFTRNRILFFFLFSTPLSPCTSFCPHSLCLCLCLCFSLPLSLSPQGKLFLFLLKWF